MNWRVLTLATLLMSTVVSAQSRWTDKETRLANEYLAILVDQPEYGRVLDMLWQLYTDHDSTAVLLSHVKAQAAQSKHMSVRLVQAHLLRKSGALSDAVKAYEEVLQQDSRQLIALRARAELAQAQQDMPAAVRYQRRLAEAMSMPAQAAKAWVQLGQLHLIDKDAAQALQALEKAVKIQPKDLPLIQQVAQLMLQMGLPKKAAELLEQLVQLAEPAQRLLALRDLARVQQLSSHRDAADKALLQALALLDFRDSRYVEFFHQRVRLYESFSTLEELHSSLVQAAKVHSSQEQPVLDLLRYSMLTVDVEEQQRWLRRLVLISPESREYRWQLVHFLLDHDCVAEAAGMLDKELQKEGPQPSLVILRAKAELRSGHREAAAQRLTELLKVHAHAEKVQLEVLHFAQEHALDDVVESLLRQRLLMQPQKNESVYELAAYLQARERYAEMEQVLLVFCNSSHQAECFSTAASFLAAAGRTAAAQEFQKRAASLLPNSESWIKLADYSMENKAAETALEELQHAYALAKTAEDKFEIDERIFSALQGREDAKPLKPSVQSTEFKLPSFLTGEDFVSNKPLLSNDASAPMLTEACTEYWHQILKTADQDTLRAAWWAHRIGLNNQAVNLLRPLLYDAGQHRKDSSLVAERLLLEVELDLGHTDSILQQLKHLVDRDVQNRVPYLLRLAEQHLGKAQPELALQYLKQALQEKSESDAVLSALTQYYQSQGQADEAIQLWEQMIRRKPGPEGTALKLRYSELLLQLQRITDYLRVTVETLTVETDLKRRREILRRMLDRLTWSEATGTSATMIVQERLVLLQARLRECIASQPLDGFYREALALVHERCGNHQEAFHEMRQAYYSQPDAPFSLEQLKQASLRISDLKSAIYFQKQIVNSASVKEVASEMRALIELLEQAYEMDEADKVRRRLEIRFSQDAKALEELLQYYASTGRLEDELRVLQLLQQLRSWEPVSALRVALKHLELADINEAKKLLLDLFHQTKDKTLLMGSSLEQWPLPWTSKRNTSASKAEMTDLVGYLLESRGLEEEEKERIKLWLSQARPEFALLPVSSELVRLRAVEELGRLHVPLSGLTACEKLWHGCAAGEHEQFYVALKEHASSSTTLPGQFAYAWFAVKSHHIPSALAWMREPGLSPSVQEQRERILHSVIDLMTGWKEFQFQAEELEVLGRAQLLRRDLMLNMARDFQESQRQDLALILTRTMRDTTKENFVYYSFVMAQFAEALEQYDLQRQYLWDVLAEPPRPGAYLGDDPDHFTLAVAWLCRLSDTVQERQQVIQRAQSLLSRCAPSSMTTLRYLVVKALAGKQASAVDRMRNYVAGEFISSRQLGMGQGGLMPQGSVRGEDASHLRSYWDELRTFSVNLGEQGLGLVINEVDDAVADALGSIPLGPRGSDTFAQWRRDKLMRDLHPLSYPQRVAAIRQFLAPVNMREEDAVESMMELARELEANGMLRECIPFFKGMPERAPNNNNYAEFYIRICMQSGELTSVRSYIESLFGREPIKKPQSFSDETLRTLHAEILTRLKDEPTLLRLADHTQGFNRVLPGRVPNAVPYLRELARWRDKQGDAVAALKYWTAVQDGLDGVTPDALPAPHLEALLRRAKLLLQMKNPEQAMQLLRRDLMKDIKDEPGAELFHLRSELAFQQKLEPEITLLKETALEQRAVQSVIHLSQHLADAKRQVEARNYLTHASRVLKEPEERFLLKLHTLKQEERKNQGSLLEQRSTVLTLLRSGVRDAGHLSEWMNWLKTEAKSCRAAEWVMLLKNELLLAHDPPFVAASLCMFAEHWPSDLRSNLSSAWQTYEAKDRTCLESCLAGLLEAKHFDLAAMICDLLKQLPNGLAPRLSPWSIRLAYAQKDQTKIQEIYTQLMQMSSPGGTLTQEWVKTLLDCKQPRLALSLLEKAHRLQKSPNATLLKMHFSLLLKEHRYSEAEVLLMQEYPAVKEEAAALISELYKSWGKPLQYNLAKYHLPEESCLALHD